MIQKQFRYPPDTTHTYNQNPLVILANNSCPAVMTNCILDISNNCQFPTTNPMRQATFEVKVGLKPLLLHRAALRERRCLPMKAKVIGKLLPHSPNMQPVGFGNKQHINFHWPIAKLHAVGCCSSTSASFHHCEPEALYMQVFRKMATKKYNHQPVNQLLIGEIGLIHGYYQIHQLLQPKKGKHITNVAASPNRNSHATPCKQKVWV